MESNAPRVALVGINKHGAPAYNAFKRLGNNNCAKTHKPHVRWIPRNDRPTSFGPGIKGGVEDCVVDQSTLEKRAWAQQDAAQPANPRGNCAFKTTLSCPNTRNLAWKQLASANGQQCPPEGRRSTGRRAPPMYPKQARLPLWTHKGRRVLHGRALLRRYVVGWRRTEDCNRPHRRTRLPCRWSAAAWQPAIIQTLAGHTCINTAV